MKIKINPKNKKINEGFTLLEVLISSAILIIVVAAAAGTAVMAINSGTFNRDRTIAENLARQRIEEVRSMRETDFLDDDPNTSWDSNNNNTILQAQGVEGVNIDGRDFSIRTEVFSVDDNVNGGDNGAGVTEYVKENLNMRRVIITVTWEEAFLSGERDVKIITYLTNNK